MFAESEAYEAIKESDVWMQAPAGHQDAKDQEEEEIWSAEPKAFKTMEESDVWKQAPLGHEDAKDHEEEEIWCDTEKPMPDFVDNADMLAEPETDKAIKER